ncbi:Mitochondrial Carrier (MC) Family [Thraustotheca clavata]|uniref:Mitochondrial Carrier (MC) Family n=1 Tax=Thraustotheca clavata TaxID=74557 RepID=A0A1V9ZSU8_9STRA|nr:Mitochondrial Carrier (MC) Family [Thraustotheca clavata]
MTENRPVNLVRRDSRLTVDNLLKEAFAKVDVDGNGHVNASDIQEGLKKAGVRLSTEETLALMDKLDRKNAGKVTFEDFYAIHENFIQQIFESFDAQNKGYLDEVVLQDAMVKMGIQVTIDEATTMIKELRPKDPKKITQEDFKYLYLLMRSKMVANPNLEALMWDPDVREFSKQWWKASVEVGEGGLRAPIPTQSEAPKKVAPTIKFLAGALSGVIEAIILTPLDVAKTRLQLDKTGQYKGMIDCSKQLFRAEGPKALYKGFTPWTIHVVAKNGTRFYFNAIYRKLLQDKNGQVSGFNEFVAGAMAGATEAVLIVTPFEVVKTRLQGQNIVKGEIPKYSGPMQTTMTIIKNEGPFALWKGCAPTIGRQGLNQACSFWSNTAMKKHVWNLNEGESLSPWKSMLTGMLGAIPGPCINCPMDVVKTRLMAQDNAKGTKPKYTGMVDAMRVISREEGFGALYKGLVPRLTRLCPSYGIQWLVMDQVCEYFSK